MNSLLSRTFCFIVFFAYFSSSAAFPMFARVAPAAPAPRSQSFISALHRFEPVPDGDAPALFLSASAPVALSPTYSPWSPRSDNHDDPYFSDWNLINKRSEVEANVANVLKDINMTALEAGLADLNMLKSYFVSNTVLLTSGITLLSVRCSRLKTQLLDFQTSSRRSIDAGQPPHDSSVGLAIERRLAILLRGIAYEYMNMRLNAATQSFRESEYYVRLARNDTPIVPIKLGSLKLETTRARKAKDSILMEWTSLNSFLVDPRHTLLTTNWTKKVDIEAEAYVVRTRNSMSRYMPNVDQVLDQILRSSDALAESGQPLTVTFPPPPPSVQVPLPEYIPRPSPTAHQTLAIPEATQTTTRLAQTTVSAIRRIAPLPSGSSAAALSNLAAQINARPEGASGTMTRTTESSMPTRSDVLLSPATPQNPEAEGIPEKDLPLARPTAVVGGIDLIVSPAPAARVVSPPSPPVGLTRNLVKLSAGGHWDHPLRDGRLSLGVLHNSAGVQGALQNALRQQHPETDFGKSRLQAAEEEKERAKEDQKSAIEESNKRQLDSLLNIIASDEGELDASPPGGAPLLRQQPSHVSPPSALRNTPSEPNLTVTPAAASASNTAHRSASLSNAISQARTLDAQASAHVKATATATIVDAVHMQATSAPVRIQGTATAVMQDREIEAIHQAARMSAAHEGDIAPRVQEEERKYTMSGLSRAEGSGGAGGAADGNAEAIDLATSLADVWGYVLSWSPFRSQKWTMMMHSFIGQD